MADIIKFPDPNEPSASCVQEINGVKWYKYSIDYKFEPSILGYFTFYIWATDIEDAQCRLEAIKTTAGNLAQVLDVIAVN